MGDASHIFSHFSPLSYFLTLLTLITCSHSFPQFPTVSHSFPQFLPCLPTLPTPIYRAPATTQRLLASNMRSNMRPHMPQGHTTRAVPYHKATSSEQHATRPLLASNMRPIVHNDHMWITRGSHGDHMGITWERIEVTLMIKFMIKAMIESFARITTVHGKHSGEFRRVACTLLVSLSKPQRAEEHPRAFETASRRCTKRTEGQKDRRTDRQTVKVHHKDRRTEGRKDGRTEGQIDKRTNGQPEKRTHREQPEKRTTREPDKWTNHKGHATRCRAAVPKKPPPSQPLSSRRPRSKPRARQRSE